MSEFQKLSVILPNYNDGKYLSAALQSLLEQDYSPLEVIVIDDGSTDNSIEIINDFKQRYANLRCFQFEKNQGGLIPAKKGLEMATGEYVYGIGADDRVLPGFFRRVMEMACQYPTAGLLFGKLVLLSDEGKEVGEDGISKWQKPIFAPPDVYLKEFLESESSAASFTFSTIYRRACLLEVGGFRGDLGPLCDSFAARAIALKYGACYTPERVMCCRVRANSYSQATGRDRKYMDAIITKTAQLMRSPEFREYFPESYVSWWERDYRWRVMGFSLYKSVRRFFGLNDVKPTPAILKLLYRWITQTNRSRIS